MKPMRVIQATPKAKTKILSQKRKTPNDSKGKSSKKAKKKRLGWESSLIRSVSLMHNSIELEPTSKQ